MMAEPSFEKRKKAHGVRSGEYGGGKTVTLSGFKIASQTQMYVMNH